MNATDTPAGPAARHNEAVSLVAQMTLAEKAAMASGKDFWHLQGCERLNIEPVMITDGRTACASRARAAITSG